MELDLQRTRLEGYRSVLDTVLTQEETMDSIVPDAFPDVSRIICAYGDAFVTMKQAGEGSAKITGNIGITVLYVPEGESVPRALTLNLPFQSVGDAPQIREDCLVHAAVLSARADARLINPRKLFLKAEIKLRLKVYAMESREVTCDLAGGGDEAMQKQKREYRNCAVAAVLEKPFLFSDTLRPSASKPAMEELLYCRAEPAALDAKYIGKKLVCKGEVQLSVLYRSGSELVPIRFELPFSQVLELDGAFEEGDPEVTAVLKNTDCHLRDGELDVAVEALIQASLWSQRTVTLLSDVYNTATALDAERGQSALCTMAERGVRRETARQFCESGIPAKQVLHCAMALGGLSNQRQEGGMHYSTDACVDVLYLSEDDALCGVSYTIPISCDMELPSDCGCACHCRPAGEIVAVPVTGGLEIRLEAEFFWTMTRVESIPCVTAVRQGAVRGGTEPRPSVVIRMVHKNETLWDIAKACGSTMEDICAANQLPSETLATGAILLIPTRR